MWRHSQGKEKKKWKKKKKIGAFPQGNWNWLSQYLPRKEWNVRENLHDGKREKDFVIDKSSYFPFAIPIISLVHTFATINKSEYLILKETSDSTSMDVIICKLSCLAAWATLTKPGRLQADTIFHTKSLSASAALLRHHHQQHNTISKWAAVKLTNKTWKYSSIRSSQEPHLQQTKGSVPGWCG